MSIAHIVAKEKWLSFLKNCKHCICWSICLQPDGARAVWGDISRPQVPHERLISCYKAPSLLCCMWRKKQPPSPSPNFSEENIQLLQCRGAAIKSRHRTIVHFLNWVEFLNSRMSIWKYFCKNVFHVTISKWIAMWSKWIQKYGWCPLQTRV